jgi:hypothetical protein
MQVLISNETQARTVYPPHSDFSANLQIGFIAIGLSDDEEVCVEMSIDGVNWEQLYQYGNKVCLKADNNALGCYAPCRIRLVKDASVNPVSVAITTRNTNQEG